MPKRLRLAALCALVSATITCPSFAQTSFGRISGAVTDQTGAAVASANVAIRNLETQTLRSVNSDDHGFYVATNLPIGNYSVQVDAPGFKRQQQTELSLVADGRLTVDFHLQIGDISQSVEVVTATAETLNTVSGELSRVIDAKQVDNLALNGRNYIQLITLVPGAAVTNPDQFSVNTSLSATNQVINGNRSDSQNLTIDGAFNLVAGSNGSLVNNLGADFIQEVKLQTSNFSAEYGRKSGPALNIVTKNGTNQIHGGAFEYFRNDALDARNFFSPTKTPIRFNDFGYDVGGPIKKDKFFFFFGQEWKRLRQSSNPSRQTVPSTALLSGDFSGQKQLFYPGTKNPIPNNNIASLITTDGKAIGNVFRLIESQAASFTDRAVSNNIILQPSNPLNFREDILRLDYRFNEQHTLYGRWVHDDNTLIDPFGTFSGSNLPTTPTTRMRPGQSYLIAETWLISPTLINEARANASWASQHIPPYGNTWERSTYGFAFPQLFSGGPYNDGIPDVGISGYANFKGPSFALLSPSTDIQAADTFSVIHGSHIFRFGYTYIRDRVDQNGRPSYTGNLSFNSSGNSNTTGNSLADALLGNFRTYSESSNDPIGFFRFSQSEAFMTDSWKVNRKLSLELGVRYQNAGPIYTQANNIANFVPSLYDPAQAVAVKTNGTLVASSGNIYNGLIRAGNGVPSSETARVPGATGADVLSVPTGAPRGLYSAQNRFAPRIGFAYAATNKTIVRGGFGIFYDRPQGNLDFSQANLPPFSQIVQLENGNLSNPGGASGVQAPFGNINAIDPKLDTPYTEQFSLGIQRELPKGIFLETSYVGNLGRHLLRQPDINQASFEALGANAALPASQQASVNYLRPYHGYSSILQFRSDSTSNYHALQIYGSKRKGKVVATAGYTFSKSLGDASGQGDNPETYLDRHYNYGPTSFDRRHIFFATYVYSLPLLTGQNALVRTAAGGWQLSGIIRAQSGPYFTITGSTSIGTRRADYLGGPTLVENRGPNSWINTAAFTAAPAGRRGNSGVGNVEGPGLQSYDLSVAKHFRLTERFDLRFKADFFNAFNIANFSGLNTSTSSTSFGTLGSAYPPRNIQFGLKLTF